MEKYLEQLFADLNKASQKHTPPHDIWLSSGADPDNEIELDDMSFVEEYIYGEKMPISEITGMCQEQLPPPDILNEEQQAMLSVKLEEFLTFFNFKLEFPQNFPNHQRYTFIRRFWGTEHVPVSFGTSHIEFCSYDEENCPFPGYCNTCSEFNVELEDGSNFGNNKEVNVFFDSDDDILPSPEELELFVDSRKLSESSGKAESNPEPFYCGIYNDDGTLVNPKEVSMPELCLRCRSYFTGDTEENFLCLMNRNDQKDDPNFECGAFEEF